MESFTSRSGRANRREGARAEEVFPVPGGPTKRILTISKRPMDLS